MSERALRGVFGPKDLRGGQDAVNTAAAFQRRQQVKRILAENPELIEWLEAMTQPRFERPLIAPPSSLSPTSSELISYRMGQYSIIQWMKMEANQEDHDG